MKLAIEEERRNSELLTPFSRKAYGNPAEFGCSVTRPAADVRTKRRSTGRETRRDPSFLILTRYNCDGKR